MAGIASPVLDNAHANAVSAAEGFAFANHIILQYVLFGRDADSSYGWPELVQALSGDLEFVVLQAMREQGPDWSFATEMAQFRQVLADFGAALDAKLSEEAFASIAGRREQGNA